MINLNDVISIENGIKYNEFKKQLKPKYLIVFRDIFIGYFILFFSFFSFLLIEYNYNSIFVYFVLPPFAVVIGFFIAYLQLFIHEAAHFNIHPKKKINDLLSNIFLGWFTGVYIQDYRIVHWEHHKKLGLVSDTENSYFNSLNFKFLLKTFFGLHILDVLKNRNKIVNKHDTNLHFSSKIYFLFSLLLNISLLILLVKFNFFLSALLWFVSIIVFFPFFASIRQLLEHRDISASSFTNYFQVNHGQTNRLFKQSFFAFFFGGAGFRNHLLHHLDMNISYTRLDEILLFLKKSNISSKINLNCFTYSSVFFKLLRRNE
jgi:fatty acid desaturase